MSKRLCVIPCGSAKIWDKNPNAGPTEAQYVYTGVFAAACQRYARAFFEDWVILSAKHGFLYPEDIIQDSYNVSFIKPTAEIISVEALKEQAVNKGLEAYNEITVLGGKHYVERIKLVFNKGEEIVLPLADCKGIGYMLQKLANSMGQEIQIEGTITKSKESVKLQTNKLPIQQIGKYAPLYYYLQGREEKYIEMRLEQLEFILGFTLPSSAHKHRAWWANDINHSQAKAWLYANWEIESVMLPLVKLRREVSEILY